MVKYRIYSGTLLFLFCFFISCNSELKQNRKKNLDRAQKTLESIYTYYSIEETNLLHETYPSKAQPADSVSSGNSQYNRQSNPYSYLWPYSGTFSAVIALYRATGNDRYKKLIENETLPGLKKYFDETRIPHAYASYIYPTSDRYYDDNVWIGIDFADLYELTGKSVYLEEAELIWRFLESGMDEKLGGGIYWCEQKKISKNSCSSAPGAVLALKLHQLTGNSLYYEKGKELYEWTKKNLQDSTDNLYFDRISLNKKISKGKYSYNSGQMMQAAALLYKITKDDSYLKDSETLAKACHEHFFSEFDNGTDTFRLLKNGDNWFVAIMLRGFLELYSINKNTIYLNDFQKSLDYVWDETRDKKGLFEDSRFGGSTSGNQTKWLLTQAAMVEMYARLSF